MKLLVTFLLTSLCAVNSIAQNVTYPYPVKYITLSIEKQVVKMAYMDVLANEPNGETVLLLHGKNFNGYYWKEMIPFLTSNGYRVVVPDQVGWGRSDKPNIHYSFHLLAQNTKALLDALTINKTNIIAHSMGGMLATRFALLYPQQVSKLILENPIGLEDYKTFVPYQSLDKVYENELKATYESYKKYQQSYYPVWKPEYEQYVAAQAEPLGRQDFPQTALVNAITYQMIYEQPVVYEFKNLNVKTLLIIGQEDRTIVGKNLLTKEVASAHGNYPQLGSKIQKEIKGSKLVALNGVGHIPHIQVPEQFKKEVVQFLKN
jgi:pimeloyl-ACP methyl ester carboxylesterase